MKEIISGIRKKVLGEEKKTSASYSWYNLAKHSQNKLIDVIFEIESEKDIFV